jgi:hypothetical protein
MKACAGARYAPEWPAMTPSSQKTAVVSLYTQPPPESTVICVDELGPVTPRTFPPAPGWSPDDQRIEAHLEYGRGPDKAWVYGGLNPQDGQTLTMTAPSRNSDNYCRFLGPVVPPGPHSPVGGRVCGPGRDDALGADAGHGGTCEGLAVALCSLVTPHGQPCAGRGSRRWCARA